MADPVAGNPGGEDDRRPPAARRPPARDETGSAFTPEQRAALDDLFGEKLRLGGRRLTRDELHER